MEKWQKAGVVTVIVVSIPTCISALIFNSIPSAINILLLISVAIAALLPIFGFDMTKVLDLTTVTNPPIIVEQLIQKDDAPAQLIFEKADSLVQYYEPLKAKLLELTDLDKQPAGNLPDSLWNVVLTSNKGDFSCSVQKRVGLIVVDFEATAEETFDRIADIRTRPEWDDICESSGVVEQVSNMSSIQFMRTKGIWPTAPRSALVMSFIAKVGDKYLNVTKSIDSHPKFEQVKGDVTMLAHIAGVIVSEHPTNTRYCIQIVDGDLGGWLPSSVVSMITTQAFPISMRRANSQLKKVNAHKTISTLIEYCEGRSQDQAANKAVAVGKPPTYFQMVLRALQKSQPWMVLLILALAILRRSKK